MSDEEVKDSISYSEVRDFFADASKMRTYQPGDYVIRQGELVTDMVYIESGEVEVVTLREQQIDDDSDDGDDYVSDALDDIMSIAMMNKVNEEKNKQKDERRDSAHGRGRSFGGLFARCFGRDGGKMRRNTSVNAFITKRGPKEFIGETFQSLEPSRHSASFRATIETRCFRIPHTVLMETLQEQPEMLEEIRLSALRYGLHCLQLYNLLLLCEKEHFLLS